MNRARILVVDDDPDLLHLLGIRLAVAGYEVIQAQSGEEALDLFSSQHPQAVITDLRMGGMDGHALFTRLHEAAPSLPVIILTAHGTIPDAVAATQRGAFSFLTKPFDGKELLERVAAAVSLSPPIQAVADDARWRETIISVSPLMDELLRQARRAADEDGPLLLIGPPGVGKATLAKAIHGAGSRAEAPFLSLSCAVLPAEEIEQELFGGEGGVGPLLHSASGGSLYIDEVEALSPVAQARLLPLVRSRSDVFGLSRAALPDVRIFAASTQPLDRAIRDSGFRPDLYYALATATLKVPPLAERSEDIPVLAAHFLECHGNNRHLSPEAMALLLEAPWPGNVLQLEAVLEQALRLAVTPLVPASLIQRLLSETSARCTQGFDEARRAFERQYLADLLQATGGNVARAARIAQRNRTEFYKLLARNGLDPASFK